MSTAQLLTRVEAPQPAESFRVLLIGGPQASARARAALATLRSDLDDPLVDNLRLLVTELVTNCVRHAEANRIELAVSVAAESVRVEVDNPGMAFAPPTAPASMPRSDQEGGWGLFLVERLSNDWGVVDHGGHTRVWFEIARA